MLPLRAGGWVGGWGGGSYQDRSTSVRFSGTGCTSSSLSSANTADPGHITPQQGHTYRRRRGAATVVRSVQALEGVAAHSEEVEGVSVAAEELQSAQSSHVQLLQASVPHVQLGDVDQLLRVSHSHRLNLVQPGRERGERGFLVRSVWRCCGAGGVST